jgi:MoxR-like ATPase
VRRLGGAATFSGPDYPSSMETHARMSHEIEAVQERIRTESAFVERLEDEVGRVIVGQKYMVERLLIGLLADGHVLMEGVPGLAKTLTVRTLARAIDTGFQRIQFTPDLLPADLIGTLIFDPKTSEFKTKKGPIFSNIILADEINRSPAKVQSALLEAMQERTVTIGEETFALDEPFLVLATQNPIEQEGTYPLPEAQVDRFMLKLSVGYPDREEELEIIRRMGTGAPPEANPVVSPEEILRARAAVDLIYMDSQVERYIVDLVFASREPAEHGLEDLADLISFGASPRASICLAKTARAHAFLRHRGYVTPEDVRSVALDVLRHRVLITYEAEAEEVTSEDIVTRILDAVEVP